jgi:hypothetical protein
MRAIVFYCMVSFGLFSCSKSGGSTPALLAPSNLMVNATVNSDNSGNVSFTATASNAVSYEFDYGNGIFEIAVVPVLPFAVTLTV